MKAGEWTLRSRRVVTPEGTRAADVRIRDETIIGLADHDAPDAEGVILDVGDLAVLPGLVALHREGARALDGRWFETATRDAGSGGVTTLVDLPPRSDSGADGAAGWMRRLAAAEGKIRVDCGLVVPLGSGNVDRIESWIEAGFLGVEAILGDGDANGEADRSSARPSDEADLRAAMPLLAELGRPLFVDLARTSRASGPSTAVARPARSLPGPEAAAIRLVIRLCREARCRVHLIQPSAGEALPMIAEARAEGLPLTVETCPGHLGFAAWGAFDERSWPWDGLESGQIDAVGPDFPGPTARPTAPTPAADPGEVRPSIVDSGSLREALPATWAEARRRGFTLDHLARWLAGRPAEVVGLAVRKGSIAPGLDADLVIFDPEASSPEAPERRQRTAPTGPPRLAGLVRATILRGTMIYQAGLFFDHPRGSVVLRLEETQPISGSRA